MSNDDRFRTSGGLDFFREALSEHADTDPFIDQQLGNYRVLSLLAKGGMARVYRAERIDGSFEREVAIKILPSGLSQEYARRFEIERKILASLSHNYIAQLYDAGVSPSGNLFLVMELIDGQPIDAYASDHTLGTAAKTRLMLNLGEALAFAHSRLVVHRDLKPSNVLVTVDGSLKLLDFGIAKIVEPSNEETVDARPMTPRYASPEQLLNEPVSVASDIYQFGLLFLSLFKRRAELDEDTPASVLKRAMQKTSLTVDSQIATTLPLELVAILNKCLRAEPGERYGSATELVSDLRNYLNGFPVSARNPGPFRRATKFLRRNWLTSGAVALAGVSLLVFLVSTLRQQAMTEEARDIAERQKARAEQTTEFLIDLFDANRSDEALGEDLTARDILERGQRQLDELEGQPELKADLLEAIGGVYRNLGDFENAIALVSEALEIKERTYRDQPVEMASTLELLSRLQKRHGQNSEALATAQRALDLRTIALGEHHEDTLQTLSAVGYILSGMKRTSEAIDVNRRVLEGLRAIHGENHTSVTTAINNLAAANIDAGNYARAAELLEEVMKWNGVQLPEDHPWVATDLMNYAGALGYLGRHEESVAAYERSIEMRRKMQGKAHPDVFVVQRFYAAQLERSGRHTAALEQMTEAYELGQGVGSQLELIQRELSLGNFHTLYGDQEFAEKLLMAADARLIELYGAGTERMPALVEIARLRLVQGNPHAAVSILVPVAAYAEASTSLLPSIELLARSYLATGQTAEADSQLQALRRAVSELGKQDQRIAADMHLASSALLIDVQLPKQAAIEAEKALDINQRLRDDHWKIWVSQGLLAEARLESDDADNARSTIINISRKVSTLLPAEHDYRRRIEAAVARVQATR
ncbi:MAG: serine/threonine-protein kinase [Gammaproteobacteria bacterium]|nr:serine/threonine-protein kinase [Gammaproteobacteria bacterium]